MEVNIREMKSSDWDAVAAIYKEGIDIKIATFQSEVPTYEEWDKAHIKSCRFVAESDGKVIGWTSLTPYSNRCVYSGVAEISIYVKSEYRGMHVGEKLMKTTIEESEKEGFWSIISLIIEINERSIALHRKAGFRMIGYREKVAKDNDGIWQNIVEMERRSKVVGVD